MNTMAECIDALEKAYNEVTFKKAIIEALDRAHYDHVQTVNQQYPEAPIVYIRYTNMYVRGLEYEVTLKNGKPIPKPEE